MPFVSRRQMRWMWANHPEMARRWADHTPDIKSLPETADGDDTPAAKSANLLDHLDVAAKTAGPVDFALAVGRKAAPAVGPFLDRQLGVPPHRPVFGPAPAPEPGPPLAPARPATQRPPAVPAPAGVPLVTGPAPAHAVGPR